MTQNLLTLSATQALAGLQSKQFSSVELTHACLARLNARTHLNTAITVDATHALNMAKSADARRAAGDAAPLLGLPLGIKDLFCTQGLRTTAASQFLNNFVPAYESTVTRKLWDAGAVCVAKLNMDEFAMGGSGENSAFGATHNPWAAGYVPGGSSSGSAAAVADYQVFAATGSDTGGSIRQPAAFTGLVGIKPTYGRCSRWGMVAFASSLDQAGIFARTTADAALLLETVAGHDPMDSTSASLPVPQWRQSLSGESSVKGLKIGLPKQYFIAGLDPQVAAQVQGMAQQLAAAGAQVVEVDLPHTEYAVAAYYVFAPAEAASNLARYDGLRFGVRVPGATLAETYANSRSAGFGREVQRRIMIGNYVLSSGYYDAYYTQAMRVRQLVAADFTAAFQQVDVILAPTAPSLPFKIGAKSNDPVALYLEDAFTIPVSAAGLPALSVPTGTVTNAAGVVLPVGAQLIAPHWQEARLFQVAHAWEHLRGPFTPPFQV